MDYNDEPTSEGFRFVAIDVETANPNPRSICQIGFAGVTPSGEIKTLGTLIDPREPFHWDNINIHGIDDTAVRGQPTFSDILPAIRPLIEGIPLVQHSSFDSRAIAAACAAAQLPPLLASWHNSVIIARRAWPQFVGKGGHGLKHLKRKLKLDFEHHDAIEDARATAQIVLLAEQEMGLPFQQIIGRGRQKRTFSPAVTATGAPTGALLGEVAVFTGQLSISREDAATFAAAAGITVKASVTKKTTLLIVGDQDLAVLAPGQTKSTKHRAVEQLIAEGHNIRIMGETEFLRLVGKM